MVAPVLVRRTTRTAVCATPWTSKSRRTRASGRPWLMTGCDQALAAVAGHRAVEGEDHAVDDAATCRRPVGPTNANRSASVKSTTVGARKAEKPSSSTRSGLTSRPPRGARRTRPAGGGRRRRRRPGSEPNSSLGRPAGDRRARWPPAHRPGDCTSTSTQCGNRARTSSASPARRRSVTTMRRKSSPVVAGQRLEVGERAPQGAQPATGLERAPPGPRPAPRARGRPRSPT